MKREHVFFGALLVMLFIAPEIPIDVVGLGGPSRASLSLGIIVLLLWVLARPRPGSAVGMGVPTIWALFVGLFAAHVCFASLRSRDVLSVLYASQYALYVLFGFVALAPYFREATRLAEEDTALGVLVVVGLVYSLGALVSLVVGPLYAHQVLWPARMWGNYGLARRIGFGGNPNRTGGVLIFFLAVTALMYPHRWRWKGAAVGLTGAGLLATLSRSAIFASVLGWLALMIVSRVCRLTAKVPRDDRPVSRARTHTLLATSFAIAAVIACSMLQRAPGEGPTRAILESLGMARQELLWADVLTRFEQWTRGWVAWLSRADVDALLGVGFRRGAMVGPFGAWLTAHNFYLDALNDFGVVGLCLFLMALLGCLLSSVIAIVDRRPNSESARCTLVALCGLAIHNLSEDLFYSPAMIVLFLICALFLGIESRPERPQRRNGTSVEPSRGRDGGTCSTGECLARADLARYALSGLNRGGGRRQRTAEDLTSAGQPGATRRGVNGASLLLLRQR